MKLNLQSITKLLVVAVVCLLTMGTMAQGQLLFNENFTYSTGQLTDLSGGGNVSGGVWVDFSGTGNPIQVSSGSLLYSGYASSNEGNKIDIISTSGSAEDAYRAFTTQSAGTIYSAFLLKLANTTGLSLNSSTTGDYLAGYTVSSTTSFINRLSIRLGSVAGTFQLGIRGSSAATVGWYTTDLNPGTTYLVVFSHQFVSGTANDISNLWVNPALGGAEPAANATSTSGSDPLDAGKFFVRQGTTTTPNASIDGIRVATLWDSVATYDASKVISSSSDIQAAGNETSNIDYASYQLASIGATTDAVRVFSFTIRDGGGSADADAFGTELTSITFTQGGSNGVTSWANTIRQAALYDGATEVAEVSVTGETIAFTGLSGSNVTAADDGSKTLDLYLTFEAAVTDNEQFQFQVTNSNVSASGSTFAGFTAQTSSTTGDANRIEVTASKLTFTENPPATVAVNVDFGSEVRALDALNNRDKDFTGNITVGVQTGTGAVSSVAGLMQAAVEGVAAWTDLQYNTAETGVQLDANSGVLTEGLSTTFDAVNLSALSDVVAGVDAEPATISSTVDAMGEQVQVFDLTIRDGGGSPDGDGSATKITNLVISQSGANTAADWTQYIQGAELYNGITSLGTGTVIANALEFTNAPLVSASDNDNVTVQLKIYLNSTLPAGADGKVLGFKVNQNTDVTTDPTGSLMAAGGADVTGSTTIDVATTQIVFGANIGNQKSGTAFATSVSGTDVNANIDADFVGTVDLTVSSGSGLISGTTNAVASAGTASFTGVIIDGAGEHVLQAASGAMTVLSNIFAVDSSAMFKVANVAGDTLAWDDANTWQIVSGYDASGIPDANDDVVLDNEFRTGNYIIRLGPSVRDTAKSVTIGYAGNTNTLELLLPSTSTLASQLVCGDALAGNYDFTIMEGGLFMNKSGATSGNPFSIRGFSPPNDTIWIRTGGKLVHATVRSASYIYRTSKRIDSDNGTFEYDIPGTSSFFTPGSGAFYPNLVFSATNAGGTRTYTVSNSSDPNDPTNPLHAKGNLTINTGVTLLAGSGGFAQPLGVYGDFINYGTFTSDAPSTVKFMGSDQQEVIGNSPTLNNGLIVDNSFGVTLQTNLNIAGGTATITNGSLSTSTNTVYLDPAGSLSETGGTIVGTTSATRTASQNVNETFGNIGFEMNALAAAPGVTTVVRTTGTALSGNGNFSVRRYFDVTSEGTEPYNATVNAYYNDAELNGNPEAALILHYSTDGGTTWSGRTGTVNTPFNRVTTTGMRGDARYTFAAGDAGALYTTHTVQIFKYEDNDGDIATPGTQKRWYMGLYENSIDPAYLVKGENNDTVTVTNLPAGAYIAWEADSAGWVHAGHIIDNGFTQDTLTNTLSYDTITVSSGAGGRVEFFNSRTSSIVIQKYRDLDGDPNTTGDQTAKTWGFAVYRDTIGGTPVTEGNASELIANDLASGTYVIVEADSAGWFRCNGGTSYETVVLGGNSTDTVVFMNVKASSLTIRKWEDGDGDINTTGDQSAKDWYLEIRSGSPTGTLVSSGTGTSLSNALLADGMYYAVEADSGWVSLGYKLNGAYVGGSADQLVAGVDLSDGESDTIDFYNAPPIYGQMFRAFNPDSLVLTYDNLGKVGKSVKKKNDKVQFTATFTVPGASHGANGLYAQFGVLIDTTWDFTITPSATITELAKSKLTKFYFAFASPLDSNTVVTISGYGKKGSNQKVPAYWWTSDSVLLGKKLKNPTVSNTLRLPMPNRLNVVEETFAQGAFPGPDTKGGMWIGVPYLNKDSLKKYGYVLLKKAPDVYKTLFVKSKTGYNFHDGTPRGLDSIKAGTSMKSLVGKLTSLPPTKQDNILYANLVALKLSIAASAMEKTPLGFGELILNDTVANPLNGMTLAQISAEADTMMSGYAGRTFETAETYANLSNTIRRVLDAFEGDMDTISFGAKLMTAGTARLVDCAILQANPNATPARIIPKSTATGYPEKYELYQNYPNPFNPSTMIEFDLPVASTVTLKVYNLLGQEVATLLNNQLVEEGAQAVEFNAANYPSGVYFYRINVESVDEDGVASTFTQIMKMMLMK